MFIIEQFKYEMYHFTMIRAIAAPHYENELPVYHSINTESFEAHERKKIKNYLADLRKKHDETI